MFTLRLGNATRQIVRGEQHWITFYTFQSSSSSVFVLNSLIYHSLKKHILTFSAQNCPTLSTCRKPQLKGKLSAWNYLLVSTRHKVSNSMPIFYLDRNLYHVFIWGLEFGRAIWSLIWMANQNGLFWFEKNIQC